MSRRCLAVWCVLAAVACDAEPVGAETVQIVSRAVVDPESGTARSGQVVVVEDGRIREVRRGAPLAGVPVVDLDGAHVLPGLYDLHTHLCARIDVAVSDMDLIEGRLLLGSLEPTAYRSLQGAAAAREMLEAGFTTVRDLGNAGAWADIALRRAIETPGTPGAPRPWPRWPDRHAAEVVPPGGGSAQSRVRNCKSGRFESRSARGYMLRAPAGAAGGWILPPARGAP